MTAVSDAERAVVEARSRVIVYLTSAGLSTPRATANADALVTAVRRHDAALAQAEALHDNTGTDADEAYQQAIGDVVGAITAQIGETT